MPITRLEYVWVPECQSASLLQNDKVMRKAFPVAWSPTTEEALDIPLLKRGDVPTPNIQKLSACRQATTLLLHWLDAAHVSEIYSVPPPTINVLEHVDINANRSTNRTYVVWTEFLLLRIKVLSRKKMRLRGILWTTWYLDLCFCYFVAGRKLTDATIRHRLLDFYPLPKFRSQWDLDLIFIKDLWK